MSRSRISQNIATVFFVLAIVYILYVFIKILNNEIELLGDEGMFGRALLFSGFMTSMIHVGIGLIIIQPFLSNSSAIKNVGYIYIALAVFYFLYVLVRILDNDIPLSGEEGEMGRALLFDGLMTSMIHVGIGVILQFSSRNAVDVSPSVSSTKDSPNSASSPEASSSSDMQKVMEELKNLQKELHTLKNADKEAGDVAEEEIVEITDYSLEKINTLIYEIQSKMQTSVKKEELIQFLASIVKSEKSGRALLKEFENRYSKSLTEELGKLSKNYNSKKQYLTEFIEYKIVEAEFPHTLIE